MAELELFYIGTSKVKEIRAGGDVSYDWGDPGGWINFAAPNVTSSTIKAKTKPKDGYDKDTNATSWDNGGTSKYGTSIPATETRTIEGVERQCDVQYRMKKYFKYTQNKTQKKKKKCTKKVYTYYCYQKRWKEKPIVAKEYSTYENGMEYIFFGDHYYDDNGDSAPTPGHLPHPVEYQMTYSDVRKNFESSANNSDSRDNQGSFILSNVRANIVNLSLKWAGLSAEHGQELIDTLNPQKDDNGEYPYLIVQYRDMATGKAKNGTFYSGDRVITKYANGIYKEISVTLTEV